MKLLLLILFPVLLFSCQKSSDSSSQNGNVGAGGPQQGTPVKKTLKFNEIIEQDLTAKETMNWGNAESFVVDKQNESEMVRLSYFFQENKLIKSKEIEKSKGYCEFSTVAKANANGSEIILPGREKLFRFMESRKEKTEVNNLDYKYDAMFKFTFRSIDMLQFEIGCYNILDLAEMKSAIGSKFTFTKREEKETK